MKEIKKIAIAGCGRIAFSLEQDPLRYKPCTHLGALRYWQQKNQKIVPVGFCDHSLVKAERAAQFANADQAIITDKFELLLQARPDLLIIAASTAAHSTMLKAALKAQIPRIIIEKPIAASKAEALALRRMVKQSKSVVLPNYERRYHEKYIRLRRLIASQKKTLTYRGFFAAGGKSLYYSKSGDEGVLLHDTTHLVDLAQFLFGRVKKSSFVAEKKRHVLMLEHVNGASGLIETNLGIGVFHLELEIRLVDRRITVGNGFTITEKIAASRHYQSLKSYQAPQRVSDVRFPIQQNPFVRLYQKALFDDADNDHFFEAVENVSLLSV